MRNAVMTLPLISGAIGTTFAVSIRSDEARVMVTHAIREYPREVCGLLLTALLSDERVLLQGRNIADNPLEAFEVDPETLATAESLMNADPAYRLLAIYHSHPNGFLGLSEEDRTFLAPNGIAVFPNTYHIIVGVVGNGKKCSLAAHFWNCAERRFSPARLSVQP